MSEETNNLSERSLEEVAAELSEGLPQKFVEIRDSSAGRVEGGQISMENSAASSLHANALQMVNSGAGIVRTGSAELHESAVGALMAQSASLESSTGMLMAAGRVEAADVRTVLLLAGRVDGQVQAFLTPLTALALGAGLGLAIWLAGRLFGRRKSARRQN